MDDNGINGLSEDELRDIVAHSTLAEAAKKIGISQYEISKLRVRFGVASLGRGSGYPVSTLCWHCKNSTNGIVCPWARDYSPVPGWTAESTLVKCRGGDNNEPYFYSSMCVTKCPLFCEDERDPARRIRAANAFGSDIAGLRLTREERIRRGEEDTDYENH